MSQLLLPVADARDACQKFIDGGDTPENLAAVIYALEKTLPLFIKTRDTRKQQAADFAARNAANAVAVSEQIVDALGGLDVDATDESEES